MRVVLLERIAHLGQMGEVADVRSGYARNYLIPRGKALRATPANLERFESERAEIEARDLERRREAESVAARIQGLRVAILRQASDTGSLYGSVTPRDIVDAFADDSVQIRRQQIAIDSPIKTLGMHDVEIVVHPEVRATVTINIARTEEEAEMQALGHVVGESTEDEDSGVMEEDTTDGGTESGAEAAGESADAESGDEAGGAEAGGEGAPAGGGGAETASTPS